MVERDQYNHVGDKYHDPKGCVFRELKKANVPFRTKIAPENDGYGFFKKVDYAPSVYKENVPYQKTQPLDKRRQGFGSRDAARRDEFTNTKSTERFREVLRKEQRLLPKPSMDLLTRPSTAPASPDKRDFPFRVTVCNYDLGRNQVTHFDPKVHRDRYYKMAVDREKVTGIFRPSSADIGRDIWSVQHMKPLEGTRHETKLFFDKSHLRL